MTAQGWSAGRVLLVGAGPRAGYSVEHARRVATVGGLVARQHRARSVVFWMGEIAGPAGAPGDRLQAIAEGLTLAEFDLGRYKTGDPDVTKLQEVQILGRARRARRRRRA